jgi:hypothetical protein
MAPDPGSFDPRRPTRRQLLKAGGLTVGAPGLARPARAQTPRLLTQASVKGFRQHPTTRVYGLEGAWIERA